MSFLNNKKKKKKGKKKFNLVWLVISVKFANQT